MNGLMAVQTIVAIMLVRRPRLRWAYYALMPVLALLSLATWHGLPSLLAATATTLSTLGRMQRNEIVLRILLLASTPFWTAHDLAVGSLPGLIADLLSMAIGATMLLRRSPALRASLIRAMRQPDRFAGGLGRLVRVSLAVWRAQKATRPGTWPGLLLSMTGSPGQEVVDMELERGESSGCAPRLRPYQIGRADPASGAGQRGLTLRRPPRLVPRDERLADLGLPDLLAARQNDAVVRSSAAGRPSRRISWRGRSGW
jgi:Bacterial inner membrane protein